MVRRFILVLLVVAASASARAETLASLGTTMLFETSASGRTFDQRQPWAIRGGYRFERFDVYAEFARFLAPSNGTSFVSVARQQDQLLLWGRHVVRKWRVTPFGAAAVGALTEKIETKLGNEERTDSGRPEPVLALAAGAIAPIAEWCEISLETRAETSPAYAPHPVFGLSVFGSAKF